LNLEGTNKHIQVAAFLVKPCRPSKQCCANGASSRSQRGSAFD